MREFVEALPVKAVQIDGRAATWATPFSPASNLYDIADDVGSQQASSTGSQHSISLAISVVISTEMVGISAGASPAGAAIMAWQFAIVSSNQQIVVAILTRFCLVLDTREWYQNLLNGVRSH